MLLLFGARLESAQLRLQLHQPLRERHVVGSQADGIVWLIRFEGRAVRCVGERPAVSEVNRRVEGGVGLVGLVGGLSQKQRG